MVVVSDISGEVIKRGAGATVTVSFHSGEPCVEYDLTRDEVARLLECLAHPAPTRTWSLSEIRKTYQRAYAPWTSAEEAELRELYASGSKPKEIAQRLQRQPSAIRSRLRKLQLVA